MLLLRPHSQDISIKDTNGLDSLQSIIRLPLQQTASLSQSQHLVTSPGPVCFSDQVVECVVYYSLVSTAVHLQLSQGDHSAPSQLAQLWAHLSRPCPQKRSPRTAGGSDPMNLGHNNLGGSPTRENLPMLANCLVKLLVCTHS